MTFPFKDVSGYQLQVFGVCNCLSLHSARAPIAVHYSRLGHEARQTTYACFCFKKRISHRNAVMETKATDFVSTVSKTINV